MEQAQEHRFWRRVNVSGPDDCWEWTGSLDPKRYGHLVYEKRHRYAHRLAYELKKGSIPPGLVIRHSCHNPPCCNPAHLSTGTKKQNAEDMVAAGRSCKGPRHGSKTQPHRVLRGSARAGAKLFEAQVMEIRRRYSAGETSSVDLGDEFGVSHACVMSIVTGKTWRIFLSWRGLCRKFGRDGFLNATPNDERPRKHYVSDLAVL